MMGQIFQEVKYRQEEAKKYGRKGDALRKLGREEDALDAYRCGVKELDQALKLLGELQQEPPPEPVKKPQIVSELVETYGLKGGLLQRLGKTEESLESYLAGGSLEDDFKLPNTYNRLNAIKQQILLPDNKKTLDELKPRIRELDILINKELSPKPSQMGSTNTSQSENTEPLLSDSAWAWADLGDCRALLGDLKGAEEAYANSIAKADTKSPERTLHILTIIAEKLKQDADPNSESLFEAIKFLKTKLQTK